MRKDIISHGVPTRHTISVDAVAFSARSFALRRRKMNSQANIRHSVEYRVFIGISLFLSTICMSDNASGKNQVFIVRHIDENNKG